MATYLPLGVGPAEMELLLKHGIKYDKRQKRQLLEAYHDQARPILAVLLDYFSARKLKIPQDYLDFLSQHNGGRPEPGSLRLQTQIISIQYFYAYSSPLEACTLDYASTLYQGRIPHGLLPIAHDSSGSLLLLNGAKWTPGIFITGIMTMRPTARLRLAGTICSSLPAALASWSACCSSHPLDK